MDVDIDAHTGASTYIFHNNALCVRMHMRAALWADFDLIIVEPAAAGRDHEHALLAAIANPRALENLQTQYYLPIAIASSRPPYA